MQYKLFMVLLGATPPGRLIEQHDIFFGVAESIQALVPQMKASWPEARVHIDAWREVTFVDGYSVKVAERTQNDAPGHLFFINLGGYKPGELEEYHFKVLAVAENLASASKKAKATAFYKQYGFKGAASHIDDRYGLDVDDIYKVTDILPSEDKARFSLDITKSENLVEDELHIGYLKI